MKTRSAHRIFSLLLSMVMLLSTVVIPAKAADLTTPKSIVDVSAGQYTYSELHSDLNTLKTTYADIIGSEKLEFTTIGKTELGRDIPAVILGNQNAPQKLYVQGALQASDSLSAAFVVKQLEYYLANWNNTYGGTTLSAIFDSAAIAFVPMVNPDGVTLVTEGEETALSVVDDAGKKSNYSAAIAAARTQAVTNDPNGGTYDGASYWNANINGVDLYYNFFNRTMLWRGSNGQDGSTATNASGGLGNYLIYHNGKGAKLLSSRAYGSYGTSAVASSSDSTDACSQPESAAVKAFLSSGGYTAALDYGNSFAKDSNDKACKIYWDYKLDEYFPKEGGVIGDERLSGLASALSAETGYTCADGIGPKGFSAWFQTETNGKFAAKVNLSDDFDAAFTDCKDASLFVLTYCMNTSGHPMGFEIVLSEMKEVENSILTGDTATGKYTYTQMMADIETLKATYSDLVSDGMLTVKTIGQSELGRDIPVVILGNRQAEYKLYVQGAAQATEYQNALILMKQIEYYCANMDNGFNGGSKLEDQTLRDTFADAAIAFVPMANPDGVMLVLEGYDSLDETGLNLSDDRKAEIKANCTALLNGADLSKWDTNINGIDVYYNVYTSQMATKSGIYNDTRKKAAYTSGTSCNTAFGGSGMCAAESKAISDFITGEQFNLLLDYQLGGTTSKFSNGSTSANPKDLRWAVSDLQKYGYTSEEDIAQRNAFNSLSGALASFTGYNNAAIHSTYANGKWSGKSTGGLSARALDGWFQVTFRGSFGCVLDNASCTSDSFAQTWEKRKEASLFLLRYAAEKKLVEPIDRSMDIGYESVVDTENQKYDYYDIKEDLAALEEKYAALVSAGKVTFTTIGKSELGRDIPVVIIGNRSADNKLYVMGNEHAREDINARLVVKQIELYLEMLANHSDMLWQWNYENGGVDLTSVTWGKIFEENCIALVPTANPDGLQLIYDGEDSLYDEDCTAVTDAEKEAIWENVETLAVEKYANLKAEEGYIGGEITDTDEMNQQVFYTEDGEPYNYTLWKSNIKGIDIFYNFYDWNMYNLGNDYENSSGGQLTTLSSFLSYWKARADAGKEVDYYSPSSETSYGTFGMMAAETKAIAGFIVEEGFNMAITYHNRGPVLKWNYRLESYYPAESGVDASSWSSTIKEICNEIAKPSGYSVSSSGSLPAGFVAWFQSSHVNGFSVNVETGYGTFNNVFDASPLRIAQFDDIWSGNKYGPVIALTYCAYNNDTVIPTVSEYETTSEDYWENYWPDFKVQYGWSGKAPDGLAVPVDDASYSYEQYLTGDHLTTIYVPGYQRIGTKDGVRGTWTFNGWEFNGWLRGEAVMDYVGSWSFEAATSAPTQDTDERNYDIEISSGKNGSVSVSHKTAASGTTVTLTIKSDKGYTLETLRVLNRQGKEIDLNAVKIGEKYTFRMPTGKVTVEATFQEDNSMLNYFIDVNARDYYYDSVLWAAENGITQGTDSLHFSPDDSCTRAQAVTFLWRAAGSPEPKTSTMPFRDVKVGSYYYKAVLWATENGITKGTSKTTFSPDTICTRAEIVTFLYRSVQANGSGMQGTWMLQNPFTDVDTGAYYAEPVLWAVANGVTEGTGKTTFSPDAPCTRAQIVTFLYRAMQ